MTENKSKILALKYRPKIFKELIGQEIIAETISNAIKINKTPNAYLLTGIRGVGKTTTARLIAKALNCSKNIGKGEINIFEIGFDKISNRRSMFVDINVCDQRYRTGAFARSI